MAENETVEQRAERGRAERKRTPRASHAEWAARSDRADPVVLLEEQAATRLPELVPIRYGRMVASPFTFYRGAAYLMAADLATVPRTGLEVQLCGDAHLSNFGGFASPERALLFDINDFDETLPGPFEWDVKRLAASLEIAGRSRNFSAKERAAVVLAAVRAYREAMAEFAGMQHLAIWYARLDIDDIVRRWGGDMGKKVVENLRRNVARAESKDRMKALAKLTTLVDGEPRIRSDPPLLVPVEELFDLPESIRQEEVIDNLLRTYKDTLPSDRRRLIDTYRFVHLARKVVGVGSVGARAWVALMLGRDGGDPLFIQVKEAGPSVLEPFLGSSKVDNHGQRVVEGQRIMQAASDIFLGWERVEAPDGVTRDFYLRQLWDWKASAVVDTMAPDVLRAYGQICGWTLARAHARSGDAIAISGYLGKSTVFDDAIAEFSRLYADQNEVDHGELAGAIAAGRVEARAGV